MALNMKYFKGLSKKQIPEMESKIMQKFSDFKDPRKPKEARWIENIAIYSGRQFLEFDKLTHRLEMLEPETEKEVRMIFNRVLGKCRSAVARNLKALPTAEVIPNTSDTADENAAQVATDWLEQNHAEPLQRMKKTYRDFVNYVVVCGEGFLKDVWDGSKGDTKQVMKQEPVFQMVGKPVVGEDGQPAVDEMGQPMMEQAEEPMIDPQTGVQATQEAVDKDGNPVVEAEYKTGDTCTMAVGPLQMYYDMAYREWSDVPECIQREFMPVIYVKANYPNCEDVVETDSSSMDIAYQSLYDSQIDKNSTLKKGVEVLEYWSKSTEDFKQGVHAILVGGKLKLFEPMDTLNGEELPYSHARYIPIPWSMGGIGMPELLEYIQKAYNKTVSQIIENAGDIINLKIWENFATIINEVITDSCGQRIKYMGPKPTIETPPALPQTHFQLIQNLLRDFDDISMIHREAEGGLNPSINSGDQLETQTENDQAAHEPDSAEITDAIVKSCRLRLQYIQNNVDDSRLIKTVGKDGEWKIASFKGADFRNNTNVILRPATAMQASRSTQVKEMKMMFDAMAGNPDAMSTEQRKIFFASALEQLHYGSQKAMMDDLNPQEAKAKRENREMMKGLPMFVMPWDDNGVHKTVVENFIISEDFDSLPKTSKDLFIQHFEGHVDMINKLAAASAMAVGAGSSPVAGAPPGANQPPSRAAQPGGPQ